MLQSTCQHQLSRNILNPNPDQYTSDNYIVFDFETTNIDHGSASEEKNRIICVTWRTGTDHPRYSNKTRISWDLNPYDPKSFKEFKEDLEAADFIIAHNAKFECGWLDRLGMEYWNFLYFDTMLFEYIIDGNLRNPYSLDYLASQYFELGKESLIKRLMDGGVCPSMMPESILTKYALWDTELTEMIFLEQRNRTDLFPCAYTKNLFIPVLHDIERNGMVLDAERVKVVHENVLKKYEKAVREMDELTGGINFRSSKQVSEFLYDVLKFTPIKIRGEEQRKANKQIISKLKPRTKAQKQFLELKLKLSTLEAELSKALNKFIDCVEQDNGELYAEFVQIITATQRLASKGKRYNLQFHNMPRKFKPLFMARNKGWEIVEADFAQLEFRAAVQMAGDIEGKRVVEDNEDVHLFTACELLGKDAADVTDEERTTAKADTFKPLYGGTKGTKEQVRYYEAFRKKYPQIAAMQQGWVDHVLLHKSLTLPTGVKFYWPDVTIYGSGYVNKTTEIYNYPVQYLATGEVVPIGVIHLWHRMKAAGLKSVMVNTIHDSVVSEVPPEEREKYDELVQQSFTTDVYDYLKRVYGIEWDVPLEAETKGATHWNDTEKWKKEWLSNE